ncbi:MAG: two-component system, LytTR family, response regulator [Thermodesulfobacteriota bacterium]|nr:two-component system, LytTR family, response regulator [Thermodesulfobacteriota bacterium]
MVSNEPMTSIRVVIIDDEPLARENMRDLLSAYPEVVVVGEAATVPQAREVLKKAKPDAVFLDIQMPGGTGFDVLSGLDLPLQVVFVTAYDAYAIRAFQVNAVDYLLKPIDRDLLARAVARLTAGNLPAFGDTADEDADVLPFRLSDDVLVSDKERSFFIRLKTIVAIRAYRNYTEAIVAQNQTYLFRRNLKSWQARLPIPPFLRLDRSLLINTDQVSGWRSRDRGVEVVFQEGGAFISLGRSAAERFKKSFAGQSAGAREEVAFEGRPKPT